MSNLARDKSGQFVQAFSLPVTGSTTKLSVTTTSAATPALPAGFYRFETSANCSVARGVAAVVTDMPLISGLPEYFYVDTGGIVSAITASGTATLSITLC